MLSYPEDHYDEDTRGAAYAIMCIRDTESLIKRVSDLFPGKKVALFAEVKYLETGLSFSRK